MEWVMDPYLEPDQRTMTLKQERMLGEVVMEKLALELELELPVLGAATTIKGIEGTETEVVED
jgi:hypothetical protein|uniref:Uncharacterized protein n=1 Tax=Picea glauca TaxID=3330 RepID=A0A101M325_PICGL|nr:hypothetical protein ABT39_MTgene3270 [Picea glauca]QHR89224.1 hypothetical protein Q903MT_gene3244 [Picea sitchensis]